MTTPAARWTSEPIWAHEPTRTWLSTIVRSPIQAPMFTYDGGITTTPAPRWAPARMLVPPGTIRHGPSLNSRGRHGRAVAEPERPDRPVAGRRDR